MSVSNPVSQAGETPAPAVLPPTARMASGKRYDLPKLLGEFQQHLGTNWTQYQMTLSKFLMGKLSRVELMEELNGMLTRELVVYHNRLLLIILSNSAREGPAHLSVELQNVFWNKLVHKVKQTKNGSYEKLKADIMALPLRERRRIKSITRESGKRGMITSSITLTRQALLPKIPYVQDKVKQVTTPNNTQQWSQEVVNGYHAALLTETFGLPDHESLRARMTMGMRENGLLGQVNDHSINVLVAGLETYLKNIIESAIDTSRYRYSRYSDEEVLVALCKKRRLCLSAENLYNTLELQPHLSEPNGALFRLQNVTMRDDDMAGLLPYAIPEMPERGARFDYGSSSAEVKPESDAALEAPVTTQPNNGTRDELKWMLHELLSS